VRDIFAVLPQEITLQKTLDRLSLRLHHVVVLDQTSGSGGMIEAWSHPQEQPDDAKRIAGALAHQYASAEEARLVDAGIDADAPSHYPRYPGGIQVWKGVFEVRELQQGERYTLHGPLARSDEPSFVVFQHGANDATHDAPPYYKWLQSLPT